MVQQPDSALVQNLKDAGCDARTIERFLALAQAGEVGGQLRLLDCHRSALLARVHRDEKRIACLDYLIYTLQREGPFL